MEVEVEALEKSGAFLHFDVAYALRCATLVLLHITGEINGPTNRQAHPARRCVTEDAAPEIPRAFLHDHRSGKEDGHCSLDAASSSEPESEGASMSQILTNEAIERVAEEHSAMIVCSGEGDYNSNCEEIIRFARAIEAAVLAAPTVHSTTAAEWISVDERLPDLHVTVALLDENRWMNTGSDDHSVNWHGAGYLCEFGPKYWSIFGEMRSQCLDAVTHWMPMPNPPGA